MKINNIVVSEDDDLIRIDKYLSLAAPELTRNRIQGLISDGNVKLDNTLCVDISFPGYFDLIKNLHI